jgi:hypothetical protein
VRVELETGRRVCSHHHWRWFTEVRFVNEM